MRSLLFFLSVLFLLIYHNKLPSLLVTSFLCRRRGPLWRRGYSKWSDKAVLEIPLHPGWFIMPVRNPSHKNSIFYVDMDDNAREMTKNHVCQPVYAHTLWLNCIHQPKGQTSATNRKTFPFLFGHCLCLCLSLLIRSFHLVCIDYRLTSQSDTLRGSIHVCSPRDTHWVHCEEECLLSWPELACESTSIIPSLWVLHNTAATIPPNRPLGSILHSSKEKWLGWLKEQTVEWMKRWTDGFW